jgi:GntR family transcriptional regulator, transcriptional repressor for pyruvate dehydrogenase complex
VSERVPKLRKVILSTAASVTADVLREEILANVKEEPWFLGSEDEVMHSLGVSRPTLRQALRVLEQEQLVTVRRGIGGGLYARRPTDEGVAHMASIFLRTESTTYRDLNLALSLLTATCAKLAAGHPDAEKRRSLLAYYDDRTAVRPIAHMRVNEVVDLHSGFFLEIARLASSPPLSLFMSVLVELSKVPSGEMPFDATRISETIQRHLGIARAIADGDAKRAEPLTARNFDHLLAWSESTPQLESMYPHNELRRRTPYLVSAIERLEGDR